MVSSALPGPFRCWGHRAFDGLTPQFPKHEPEQKGKEQHIWGWTSRGLARLCLLCTWKLSGTEGGNMDEEQIGEGMEHHIQELGLHLKCNASHCHIIRATHFSHEASLGLPLPSLESLLQTHHLSKPFLPESPPTLHASPSSFPFQSTHHYATLYYKVSFVSSLSPTSRRPHVAGHVGLVTDMSPAPSTVPAHSRSSKNCGIDQGF